MTSKSNPYGFGLKRRADGKSRTVKPMKGAVRILKRVQRFFTNHPEKFTEGWGDNDVMCVLQAISRFRNPQLGPRRSQNEGYPGARSMVGAGTQTAQNAAALLIETVNGDPELYDRDLNIGPVIAINDVEGYNAVMDMLNRTIGFGEDYLREQT